MIIKLEDGVWLADGEGDPSRTLVEENAKEFTDMKEAIQALEGARKFRTFNDAEIMDSFI